jgi:hypothetical protein
MKYILLLLIFFASCTKPPEMVHLFLSNSNGSMSYAFTYQGGYYSPQDSTVVVTTKYTLTLPANEPTGFIIPKGYKIDNEPVIIVSATNKLIKIDW